MATCVQNNFWKGERGVEDQGDRSQLRIKNHNTHLGLSKNLIIQSADFYYVLNPPMYFIFIFFKYIIFSEVVFCFKKTGYSTFVSFKSATTEDRISTDIPECLIIVCTH